MAAGLAAFLTKLHNIDASQGPAAGPHSFFRGGDLSIYSVETKKALFRHQDKIDTGVAKNIWEKALMSQWKKPPVWVHGDIASSNLLMQNQKLHAVIDFGQLCVGDPACDLSIAWTLFKGESRQVFKEKVAMDAHTWERAKGWTLWKALITSSLSILEELLEE